MGVWPQFRSPLIWDVFAVSTYATVSLLFWYVGLVPDLATLRDRVAARVGRVIYGMLALGLARLGAALAPLRDGLPAARRHRDAAGRLGAHGRELRLRGRDRARLAHDDLPALLRRRRDLLRLRDGADAGDSAARGLRAARTSSRCATSRTWPRSCWSTGLIVAYGYTIEAFIGLVQRQPVRRLHDLNRMTGPVLRRSTGR